MREDVVKIEIVLDNIGVYLESFNEMLQIKDVILDSLSLVSFFIEVEKEFDVWIPDDAYSVNINEYTLLDFLDKVILPLKA